MAVHRSAPVASCLRVSRCTSHARRQQACWHHLASERGRWPWGKGDHLALPRGGCLRGRVVGVQKSTVTTTHITTACAGCSLCENRSHTWRERSRRWHDGIRKFSRTRYPCWANRCGSRSICSRYRGGSRATLAGPERVSSPRQHASGSQRCSPTRSPISQIG